MGGIQDWALIVGKMGLALTWWLLGREGKGFCYVVSWSRIKYVVILQIRSGLG